jgi:hypothetical protein
LGLEGRGNISQKGWEVGVDDIVGGLDAVRACYIGRQGSRGVGDELCDVGEGQRTDNILDVSKRLRNAIGIAILEADNLADGGVVLLDYAGDTWGKT